MHVEVLFIILVALTAFLLGVLTGAALSISQRQRDEEVSR